MSFLGLSLLQWTALAAVAGFVLAAAAIVTIIVTVRLTRIDRQRDDDRRKEDRLWDSDRRKEDREHDAQLRREEREREERLRREVDEKWERRRRDEQRQREDEDAQQQVVIEFLPGGPAGQVQRADTGGADGITHQIIVTTPTAYPIKQVDAQIAHETNSGLGILPPGWVFGRPITDNGQVRYMCSARVLQQAVNGAPIVRFTDRNGNLYYSYRGYTRRFGQNTDWACAATAIDQWIRTGPKPY